MEKTNIPVQKNQTIALHVDALGSEGQGIGRYEGYAVFVPGALPQEDVRVHVLKVTAHYAIAKLLAIDTPSPLRVAPPCPAFAACGGCTLQHLAYTAQLQTKKQVVADALHKIGHLADFEMFDTLGMQEPWRYRNKGSFPFAMAEGKAEVGFYAPRSHRLVRLDDCPIQQTPVMRVALAVRDWANAQKVSVYDEETHYGTLRHVMARAAVDGSVMAVVVTHGKLPHREALIETLQKEVSGLTGILHNRNDAHTNVILGERFETLWGAPVLMDRVLGLSFAVSAASFLQVNPLQMERLYETALGYLALRGQETVLDVYCGIGTISLLLAQRAKRVVGIESIPEAVSDARENAARNHIANVEFQCATAEEALPLLLQQGMRPDAVVVDPPRKGCEQAALTALADCGASKLVYISCNPSTLARDCKYLCDNGFRVARVQPVDMFPHTPHVECCVLLCREKPEKVLNFRHFCDVQTFTEKDDTGRKKELNRSIGVSIARDRVTGNMSEDE